jgi:hypothetical protein
MGEPHTPRFREEVVVSVDEEHSRSVLVGEDSRDGKEDTD